ncbi:MAG: site-specific integrase [Nitrospirota bacterium]
MKQGITINKGISGKLIVSFPYSPLFVQKIKTIKGHRWHPDEKYWSFPNTDGTLEKILKVFEGEKIHIDPSLQNVITALQPNNYDITSFKTEKEVPSPLVGEGKGEGDFEDLRRELLSRKYSYKTVKGYIFYNRDFLKFVKRKPSEINDNEIKDYLLYLAEEKHAATSTLNQAINALKFYYGTMLKKKFVYEVRRPRKDKKLPVVLSKPR